MGGTYRDLLLYFRISRALYVLDSRRIFFCELFEEGGYIGALSAHMDPLFLTNWPIFAAGHLLGVSANKSTAKARAVYSDSRGGAAFCIGAQTRGPVSTQHFLGP
jgi:hypothetical protein